MMSRLAEPVKTHREVDSGPMGHHPTAAASNKGRGRKLMLPDGVFDRLVLTAIKRGSTASAVAAEILDRNLPRHRIVTDD